MERLFQGYPNQYPIFEMLMKKFRDLDDEIQMVENENEKLRIELKKEEELKLKFVESAYFLNLNVRKLKEEVRVVVKESVDCINSDTSELKEIWIPKLKVATLGVDVDDKLNDIARSKIVQK